MVSVLSVVLALAGCKNLQFDTAGDDLGIETVASGEVVAYHVQPSIGVAPHPVVVRAVGEIGGAVASDPATLAVDGTGISVSFDAWGYGTLTVEAPGSYEVTGGAETVSVHAVSRDWSGVGLFDAHESLGPVADSANATLGALLAGEGGVFWVDEDGAHSVLDGHVIVGVETYDLDGDGVLDGVAWSTDTLFVLHGRPGGGMGLATALRKEGYGIVDVGVGDPSADGDGDLVVAFTDGVEDHLVVVLEGNGAFEFRAVAMEFAGVPTSVAVGDNTLAGADQLTVQLDSGGWLRRAVDEDGEYVSATPGTLEILDENVSLQSGYDLNGDGADEMFVLGPLVPGADRSLIAYDLSDEVTSIRVSEYSALFSFGDAHNDGRDDVWIVKGDASAAVLSYDGSYTESPFGTAHAAGVPANIDFGVGIPSLMVASDLRWWWYPGRYDEDARWRLLEPGGTAVTIGLVGPIAQVDGNQFAGFEEQSDGIRLAVWTVDPKGLELTTEVSLKGSTVAYDLAVCDGIAYATTDTALHRIDLELGSTVGKEVAYAGSARVDCGAGAKGATAAVLFDGEVVWLDDFLGEVDREPAPGAEDLAVGEVSGTPTHHTCDTSGCTVTRWIYGSSGAELFAVGESDALSFVTGAGTVPVVGAGHVSIGDADGDGNLDLVALSGTTEVFLYRSTGFGYGPAEVSHTTEVLMGPALFLDGNGDGDPDLVAAREGGLFLSTP